MEAHKGTLNDSCIAGYSSLRRLERMVSDKRSGGKCMRFEGKKSLNCSVPKLSLGRKYTLRYSSFLTHCQDTQPLRSSERPARKA